VFDVPQPRFSHTHSRTQTHTHTRSLTLSLSLKQNFVFELVIINIQSSQGNRIKNMEIGINYLTTISAEYYYYYFYNNKERVLRGAQYWIGI
jgi:hypothetical protein